jgi:hypothetical protein
MSPPELDIIKTTANVVTVIVALAAIFVSAYVAWVTHSRAIMPILIFLFRKDLWLVKNVGTGPALNLHIIWQDARGDWNGMLRCYPLSPKETIKLRNYSANAKLSRLSIPKPTARRAILHTVETTYRGFPTAICIKNGTCAVPNVNGK